MFDTGVILEDELKVGPRTSLDKYDKYFCGIISSLLLYFGIMVDLIYLSSGYIYESGQRTAHMIVDKR